ncbi:MAG: DEDD exonuclease domain-containing protein [Actinomycetaceae bacterium]|nr:DEDD exonuclease domain-containing protein [Actinomycetaceae bacterium]MDU0969389.1 DEDD exonuclease domain-containing protein [Actinomycetaceae bacterium]
MRRHRPGDGLVVAGQRAGSVLADRMRGEGELAQATLDGDGPLLSDIDLVVVDLETTGLGAQAAITEIGACRIRGREILDRYSTFVNPRQPIPPAITALTGIRNADVIHAPGIEDVLPQFAQLLDGAWGIVAHNAPFDVGLLKRAWRDHQMAWPPLAVIDTLTLARLVLPRPQVANHRLGTLAQYFGTRTRPSHRALDDAEATVDVLAGLVDLARPFGLTHANDLVTVAKPVRPARRARASLARGLPDRPGVYRFHTAPGDVVYVGSATSLAHRVASYFTAAEQRGRMAEMTMQAQRVSWRPTACVAWARVFELRDIDRFKPVYNRKSMHPERYWFVELTAEDVPRLKVTRTPDPRARSLGPVSSRRAATAVSQAITDATDIRTCAMTIPAHPQGLTPCYLAELGRCSAPCLDGIDNEGARQAAVAAARMVEGHCVDAVTHQMAAITDDSAHLRFEEAADKANRAEALLRAARQAEISGPLLRARRLIIAHPATIGGWCLTGIRFGRMVATGYAPRARDLVALLEAMTDAWDRADLPDQTPLWEETIELARLVTAPGTRIVVLDTDQPLACALDGGWSMPQIWEKLRSGRRRSFSMATR